MLPASTGFSPLRFKPLAVVLACLGLAAGARPAAAASELGHPIVRSFPPGQSGIGYLCQAVTEDPAGFIYLACSTMAFCYDGATWRPITMPTECAGIRAFAVTADGTVYGGGASVIGYFRRDGNLAGFVSLADRMPPTARGCEEISDVLAVGDTVYFADEEKILVWRAGKFSVVPCHSTPHQHGARLFRVGEEVYVTAPGRPLGRLVHDRLEVVADDPVFRENRIVSIEAGRAGSLTVLTAGKGFFRLAGQRVAPLVIEANRWLAGRIIWKARRLPDGGLAVAFSSVSGEGGMRFDAAGRYVGPIDQTIGLYTPGIRNLFCDREGGLWMGSVTGMFRLEWPSAFTLFDAVNGLGSGAVFDVARSRGALYAATAEGVFRLVPRDAAGTSAHFVQVFNQPAYALASSDDGLLAVGSTHVFAQTPAGFAPVADVPPGGGRLAPSRRDPHRVWIGTTHGVRAIRFASGGWSGEEAIAGFDESVRSVTEMNDGSLLAATEEGGLFRLELDSAGGAPLRARRVEQLGADHGLPEGFSRASAIAWRGEPVVLLDNAAGPFRFEAAQRRFVPVSAAVLPPGPAGESWAASDGDAGPVALWLANSRGIYRLPPAGGAPQRLSHLVLAAAGAVTRLHEESDAGGDVLWVCGARGLVRVEVARAFPAPVPLTTTLSSRGVREGDRLPHDYTALHFSYFAPRHQLGDSVTYQTRLIGHDSGWSAWSPEHVRDFATLPAGRYRFEVRARAADGAISAPATLAFAVLAPWWLTPWAILGYVAAGGGAFAGLVRLRTRALRRRAARLERIVADRTREFAEKNVELTRLHQLELDEKISARLGEEKARLEVLRYQLNPHFLFNALATIAGLAVREPKAARAVTRQLAEFCRLTLTRGRDEFVTLEEEFQMLAGYLEVVRAGAQEPPEVSFDLDPAAAGEKIPAFLLLPLVENASKYGRRSETGALQITVAARREPAGGALVIEVANTGAWIDELADHGDTPSTGIGLENIRQRLARTHPGAHTFSTAADDGWVRVRLRLKGAAPAEPATPAPSRRNSRDA
jgi:hypothetical protein